MQEIQNHWMHDYRTWMNADTMYEYEMWLSGTWKGDQQKAHQIRRRAFSAYLFQVIGNKHLLLACIQHPICSAAQPAETFQRIMFAWEQEKESNAYKQRWQVSQRLTDDRRELTNAARAARQAFARAKKIYDDIDSGEKRRRNLSSAESAMLAEFESGSLERARDDCDAAFGWNKETRDAAGSAAAGVGR